MHPLQPWQGRFYAENKTIFGTVYTEELQNFEAHVSESQAGNFQHIFDDLFLPKPKTARKLKLENLETVN